jgi:hypothetical protein
MCPGTLIVVADEGSNQAWQAQPLGGVHPWPGRLWEQAASRRSLHTWRPRRSPSLLVGLILSLVGLADVLPTRLKVGMARQPGMSLTGLEVRLAAPGEVSDFSTLMAARHYPGARGSAH